MFSLQDHIGFLIAIVFITAILVVLTRGYLKARGVTFLHKDTKFNRKIREYLQTNLPPYSPNFLLPWPKSKVLLMLKKQVNPIRRYTREVIKFSDSGTSALDFYPKDSPLLPKKNAVDLYQSLESIEPIRDYEEQAHDDSLVIVIPGTASESSDRYVMDTCELLYKRYNLKTVVANRRGYSGLPVTGKTPLSWVNHSDLVEILQYLRKKPQFGNSKFFVLGLSLGGNYVHNFIHYCNERDIEMDVQAFGAVSHPWCLAATRKRVEKTKKLDKHITKDIQKHMDLHKDNENYLRFLDEAGITHGTVLESDTLDEVMEPNTVEEFDERVSIKIYGFRSVKEYYDFYSVNNKLQRVNKPMISVSSVDDPVICCKAQNKEKIKRSDFIFQVNVNDGGHLSYPHTLCNLNYSIMVVGSYFNSFEQYGVDLGVNQIL